MVHPPTKQLRQGAREVRERLRTGAWNGVCRAGTEVARRGPRGHLCMALLVLGYVGFLVVGVAVFAALEGPGELRARDEMQRRLRAFLRNNTCVDESELMDIAKVITSAHKAGIHLTSDTSLSDTNWDREGAFFFVGTTVTTIGYGNLAPATVGGKIFCTIFATFGIPLNLVLLNKVGQLAVRSMDWFGRGLRKMGIKERKVRLLSGGLFLGSGFAIFLLIPSAVFTVVEGWSYAESYYYAFITLSTIGFGDYVVGRRSTVQYPAYYKTMVAAWFFFGLAWLSALFATGTAALERFLAESGTGDEERRACGPPDVALQAAARPPTPRPPAASGAGRGRRRRSEFELFVIRGAYTEEPLMFIDRGAKPRRDEPAVAGGAD